MLMPNIITTLSFFSLTRKKYTKEMKKGLLFIFVAEKCSVGYTGIYCQKQCPYPRYGDGCQQVCLCSKERCSVFTGCQFESNSKFLSSLRSTRILLFLGLKKNIGFHPNFVYSRNQTRFCRENINWYISLDVSNTTSYTNTFCTTYTTRWSTFSELYWYSIE